MKNLAMMMLTVAVFAVYKILGSDALQLGLGFFRFFIAAFFALVCWLAVARVGRWTALILQGLLFTFMDAVWRSVTYIGGENAMGKVFLNDAPIGYFFVAYGIQAMTVFVFLCVLKTLPLKFDRWLYLPSLMKAKFGST